MTKPSSLFDVIEASLAARGDAPTLLTDEAQLGARSLLERVERMAALLAEEGLTPGARIIVQGENSADLICVYLAALRLGAVYVPLNTGYTTSEVAYFLADAEPHMFVCEPARFDLLREIAGRAGAKIRALTGDGGLAARAETHVGTAPRPQLGSEDLAAIVYTSGTTGRSKGAMLSQANLVSNARALVSAWRITERDRLVHALPLYHIHGLFVALNTALLAGAQVRLLPRFDASTVIAALSDATLFMGVPTHYARLLSADRFTREAVAHVRLFVSGSAPLSEAMFEAFEQRIGQRILERYGMSECGIICSNPIDGPRVAGAVGYPLEGTEVRLADERGEEGDPVATLEVRGPGVFAGYWRMPEKTASEFRDGWFVTGDLATIDETGRVRIVGRGKDLVISGGLNVYPKEVEARIEQFDWVDEAAVIGLPHEDLGEAVTGIVATGSSSPRLTEAELIASLRHDLAGFKVPKAIVFVEALPRNTMGKVQKSVLRSRYQDMFQ